MGDSLCQVRAQLVRNSRAIDSLNQILCGGVQSVREEAKCWHKGHCRSTRGRLPEHKCDSRWINEAVVTDVLNLIEHHAVFRPIVAHDQRVTVIEHFIYEVKQNEAEQHVSEHAHDQRNKNKRRGFFETKLICQESNNGSNQKQTEYAKPKRRKNAFVESCRSR